MNGSISPLTLRVLYTAVLLNLSTISLAHCRQELRGALTLFRYGANNVHEAIDYSGEELIFELERSSSRCTASQ